MTTFSRGLVDPAELEIILSVLGAQGAPLPPRAALMNLLGGLKTVSKTARALIYLQLQLVSDADLLLVVEALRAMMMRMAGETTNLETAAAAAGIPPEIVAQVTKFFEH